MSRVELPSSLISHAKLKIILCVKTSEKNHQLNLMRTKTKLKFYSIFESETNYSEFINPIGNPERRRVASRFRIGNHNVKVETGRFRTPEDLRIWDHCNLNSAESEMPVLFH